MQLHLVLTASLWSILLWRKDGISSAAEPGYLDFDNLPETNFSCESKVIGGYYADVETGCQMFHVCTIGQKGEITDIKFLCLNGTAFDQETRVCERLDEVDCSKSESFFDLNLELYGNKAHAFGGIEPESEDVIEEECNPEVDEDCQKLDESEADDGNYDNEQHTTYAPISQQSTTTKRPQPTAAPPLPSPPQHHHHHRQHFHHHTGHGHLPSQTSPGRTPTPSPRPLSTTTSLPLTTTATAIPATTVLPQVVQYQSSSPETIAALLALHNAFQQSLQLHDLDANDDDDDTRQQQQQDIRKEQPNNNNNYGQPLFHQQTHTTKQPTFYQFQQPTQQTLPRPPQLNHHFPLQQRPPTQQQQQQSQVYQPIRTSSQTQSRFGDQFGQQHQRFQSQNFQQQQQQNRNQQISLQPPPQTERSKPFSYHQQQQFDQDSTPSPYLLHQLKVNRVKEEQQHLQQQLQHGTFVRQTSHRSLASPSAIAVVTSTSTTTSVRSGGPTGNLNNNGSNKQQKSTSRHILNNHPHSISASFPTLINSNENSNNDNNNNNTEHVPPSSYDEYQEGDVRSDPFFRDVPKIGRKRRHVRKGLMKVKRNKRSLYDSIMKYQKLYLNLKKNKISKRDLTKRNSTINFDSSNNINLSEMLALNKRLINNKKFLKKTDKNNLINEKLDDSKIITYIDGKRIDDRKYLLRSNLKNAGNGTSAVRNRNDTILLDNLQLSPEEWNFFNEISAVISKYIIPPRTPVRGYNSNNNNSKNNSKIMYNLQNNSTNSTDNLSARDRFRLNLFVTLRENFKNNKSFRKKRRRKKRSETKSVSNNEHHYEVSEVIDEPTTILPFISFLSRLRPTSVHNDHNLNLESKISDIRALSLKSISDNNSSTNRRTFSKVKPIKNESTTEKLIDHSTTEENSPRISSGNFNIKRRQRLSSTTENILKSDENFSQISSDDSLPKPQLTNKTRILKSEEDVIVNTLKPTVLTSTDRLARKRNRLISPHRNFERFETSRISDDNKEITVSPVNKSHRMTIVNKKQIASSEDLSTSTDVPDKLTTVLLQRRKKLIGVQRSKINDSEPIKFVDSLTSNTNIYHRRAPLTIEPEVSTTPMPQPQKTLRIRNTGRRNLYQVDEATTVSVPSTLSRRRDSSNRSNRRRNDDDTSSTTATYSRERLTNRKSKSNARTTATEESTTPFTPLRQRSRNSQSSRNSNVEEVKQFRSSTRNLENGRNSRERSSGRRYSTTTSSTFEVDNSSPSSRNRKKLNNYEITSTTASTSSTELNLNNANGNGTFTCDGKVKGGFYADMDSDCRGFFICSEPALPEEPLIKTHFWCGQATKFNQRSRTCQADYLVECSISPRYFSLNDDFSVPSEEKDSFEPKKL